MLLVAPWEVREVEDHLLLKELHCKELGIKYDSTLSSNSKVMAL